MMKTKLYVWDDNSKQILIIDKAESEHSNSTADGERMLLVDEEYETNKARYGSYAFLNYEYLLGSWISEDLNDFPAAFRTQLLLLGID